MSSTARPVRSGTFDLGAAVTRSMLGWGVVAGPFYLAFGLVLALTRDGFDLTRHPLSALMLGTGGWLQTMNLVLTGVMVVVAGVGLLRVPDGPGRRTAAPVILYGAALFGAAAFPPDPVLGFPPGTESATTMSTSGLLHLVSGAIGFVALAVAAFATARWFARRGEGGLAVVSRIAGGVVLAGFLGGAALSSGPAGVGLLWLAVVTGFAWLLVTSLRAYRAAPHPEA